MKQVGDCKLYRGDCLKVMKKIKKHSIDLILCDLPYGVLNKGNKDAKWDSIIPFDKLWKRYENLIKSNGAIVLFSQGMFTAQLMISNKKLWRYNLVWDKIRKSGFLNSKKMPLRQHEDIVVFYKALPTYNPQMVKCGKHQRNHSRGNKPNKTNRCYGQIHDVPFVVSDEKFSTSIISISQIVGKKTIHPTQKPVSLLEYLVKTYSNPNELVLDNTMGSGSTGIACINTNRKFIGIEKDKKYFKLAYKRIKEHNKPLFG